MFERGTSDAPEDERLRSAYEQGFAAAVAGEEAGPGCTTTAAGRAWLRGYVAGASAPRQAGDG